MQPVFFPNATVSGSDDVLIQNDAELARGVERLYQLALFNNEAVSAAFMISRTVLPQRSSQTSFAAHWLARKRWQKRIEQYE